MLAQCENCLCLLLVFKFRVPTCTIVQSQYYSGIRDAMLLYWKPQLGIFNHNAPRDAPNMGVQP